MEKRRKLPEHQSNKKRTKLSSKQHTISGSSVAVPAPEAESYEKRKETEEPKSPPKTLDILREGKTVFIELRKLAKEINSRSKTHLKSREWKKQAAERIWLMSRLCDDGEPNEAEILSNRLLAKVDSETGFQTFRDYLEPLLHLQRRRWRARRYFKLGCAFERAGAISEARQAFLNCAKAVPFWTLPSVQLHLAQLEHCGYDSLYCQHIW